MTRSTWPASRRYRRLCILHLLDILFAFLILQSTGEMLNVCTDQIPNLYQIRPSETTNHTIPNITYKGNILYGDYPHFIVRPPLDSSSSGRQTYDSLFVLIMGTKGKSDQESDETQRWDFYPFSSTHHKLTYPLMVSISCCVQIFLSSIIGYAPRASCFIKSAAMSLTDIPIISLTYHYIDTRDDERNENCASLSYYDDNTKTYNVENQIDCLEQQHIDAIEGGSYGASHYMSDDDSSPFWGEILPENSLQQRLVDLLLTLDERFPNDGWSEFLIDNPNSSGDNGYNTSFLPRWASMIVAGHSQGAGHVAYLAKVQHLRGAVLVSGPQDECVNCTDGTKFWIDSDPDITHDHRIPTSYTAFAHVDEPMLSIMGDNWKRIKDSYPSSVNWISAEPWNIQSMFHTEISDAYSYPLLTSIPYANTSQCDIKEHCSTMVDDSAPVLESDDGSRFYLYEASVWPAIIKAACYERQRREQTRIWNGVMSLLSTLILGLAYVFHHTSGDRKANQTDSNISSSFDYCKGTDMA